VSWVSDSRPACSTCTNDAEPAALYIGSLSRCAAPRDGGAGVAVVKSIRSLWELQTAHTFSSSTAPCPSVFGSLLGDARLCRDARPYSAMARRETEDELFARVEEKNYLRRAHREQNSL